MERLHRFIASRQFKSAAFIGFAVGLIAFIVELVIFPSRHLSAGQSIIAWSTVAVVQVFLVLILIIQLFRITRPRQEREERARHRLRSAESDLIIALMGQSQPSRNRSDVAQPKEKSDLSKDELDRSSKEAEGTSPKDAATRIARETALRESLVLLERARSTSREDRLALSALWEVTHSRLDLYHQIATDQARRSFFTAQAAIGIGFALLIGFAVLSIRAHTTAAAVTTAALGAVSAALAGYIGRTFVRSQESSAAHLHAYFDQPLEFSKFLAAERLLSTQENLTENQRVAILSALISAMVSSNAPLNQGSADPPT